MNTSEIKKKYIVENDLAGVELTIEDGDAMMDMWVDHHPMPHATQDSSFVACVNKCMWNLEMTAAQAELYSKEFNLNVPAYRWNVEQAIINRNGGTMLGAGLEYVESLIEAHKSW